MGVEKNIVAIELASSAIRGIIGQRRADGSLQILGYEKEVAPDAIRKGTIYNIDKTVAAITAIKTRIEERHKVYVNRVYVGLAGQSLRSVGNTVIRQLDTHVPINDDIVDSLMMENRAKGYGEAEILDTLPQEYNVGSRPTNEPVGIMADRIEGQYKNVIARRTLRENIHHVMQLAQLEVANYFISPLLLAAYVLSDTEKRSGCALVDFGAETTTVAIYEKNILRHLVVIPLGSHNITTDIATSLHVDIDEAEQLKRTLGSAWTEQEDIPADTIDITGNRKIPHKTILNIIEARQQEILANVWEQIRSYEDKLLSGIIFTGGGANIRNLETAFNQLFHFDKVKTRQMPSPTEFPTPLKIDLQSNNIATLIAMLRRGDDQCTSDKPLEPGLFDQRTTTGASAAGASTNDPNTQIGQGIVNHTTTTNDPDPTTTVPGGSATEASDPDDTTASGGSSAGTSATDDTQQTKQPNALSRFGKWLRSRAEVLVEAQ